MVPEKPGSGRATTIDRQTILTTSGQAKPEGNWALSLRNQKSQVDLTGLWPKSAGAASRRAFVCCASFSKPRNGQWLVSDQYDPASNDWRIREFNIGDIRWRRLDIKKIVEGEWVNAPDLGRIEEVGFTDLMPGGQSVACSRLDWIEVLWKAGERNDRRRNSPAVPRRGPIISVSGIHWSPAIHGIE